MLSALYFVAIAALTLLSLTRRRILVVCGFYSFYALLTILDENNVPQLGPITIYRALYIVFLISLIARLVQDRDFLSHMRLLPRVSYLSLLAFLLASSLYAHSSDIFLFENPGGLWSRVMVLGLFWISAAHVHEEIDVKLIAATSAAVSFALAIWIIWNAAQLNFEAYRGGIEVNQNYVSIFVLAGLMPLTYVIFVARSIFFKILTFLILFCSILASLILASRGMLIAFVLGAIVMVGGFGRKLRPRTVLVVGLLLVSVLVIAMFLPGGDALVARTQSESIGTLNDRTEIWTLATRYFADSGIPRMIFGQGLSSGAHVIMPVMPMYANYHSEYLRWLMDQGVSGLLAFLVFLYFVSRHILQCTSPFKPLMIGWMTFLLISGLTSTISDAHLFWILFGVMVAAGSLENNSWHPSQLAFKSSPPTPLPIVTV
jgi:O-antigen ligase